VPSFSSDPSHIRDDLERALQAAEAGTHLKRTPEGGYVGASTAGYTPLIDEATGKMIVRSPPDWGSTALPFFHLRAIVTRSPHAVPRRCQAGNTPTGYRRQLRRVEP
jgi:hypothetical protein